MTQQAKRRQENLEWEGVIGSLTSATIATNFETETDETVSRGVQSVRILDVTRVALLVKLSWDFLDPK